jgi:hypothetical protein
MARDASYRTAIVKNTLSINTSADLLGTITTSGSGDSSGTITGLVAVNQWVNLGVGTEDLHLKEGSDAIDVGTDLSATFTDDIDGVTRSGTWDIGADEYVAAVGVLGYGQLIMIGD